MCTVNYPANLKKIIILISLSSSEHTVSPLSRFSISIIILSVDFNGSVGTQIGHIYPGPYLDLAQHLNSTQYALQASNNQSSYMGFNHRFAIFI